jgi:hypothetical protein
VFSGGYVLVWPGFYQDVQGIPPMSSRPRKIHEFIGHINKIIYLQADNILM